MEQWIAVRQSELGEGSADGGLAHAEMLCCRRDTAVLIDRHQHRQEVEVEGSRHVQLSVAVIINI